MTYLRKSCAGIILSENKHLPSKVTMIIDMIKKLKPGMKKPWLLFFAGAMWLGVGVLLISYAVEWVKLYECPLTVLLYTGGILLAFLIYWFGFSRFSDKNILRVKKIESPKPCVFAFQQWSSYPLVIFMISLGIYLRKYSPFPKSLLAVAYIGIGGSLFIAGTHYFRAIIKKNY
jgi:hypothetical protein